MVGGCVGSGGEGVGGEADSGDETVAVVVPAAGWDVGVGSDGTVEAVGADEEAGGEGLGCGELDVGPGGEIRGLGVDGGEAGGYGCDGCGREGGYGRERGEAG